MSNCLPCTDPIPPCQGCTSSQQCLQIARTCTSCPRYICVDRTSSSSSKSSSSGGVSVGTTAGATVGGVVGIAVLIGLGWWFWWRPKGLEQSRKRYSKHLLNRQSKLGGPGGGAGEKRKTMNGAGGDNEGVAMKRTSVHLRMDDSNAGGGETRNRRGENQQNSGLLDERDETDDNPFGDQNRSSIGTFGINDDALSTHTSEFSFRSSHSTNIIPIAYIPPHSSSLSVDDAQGRSSSPQQQSSQQARTTSPTLPRRSTMNRISIPTSMASRDSLALAGAEIIELNPLPPVLTPDTPSIPHGTTMANGAPIRPPRSPGLDLQLPKTSSPLASPPINSPHLTQSPQMGSNSTRFSRPPSGFPFVSTTTNSSGSPTSPTYTQHALSLPPPPATLGDPQQGRSGSSQSHLSVMSSFTTRSNNSTMSYILDPPQIITPVNSQGVKRVEFQQAKATKLLGRSNSTSRNDQNQNHNQNQNQNLSPTSPLATNDPFSDLNQSQEDVATSRRGSNSSRWTTTSSFISSEGDESGSENVQFLQGQSITFTNPNTPSTANTVVQSGGGGGTRGMSGMSQLSVDLPRSARSSRSYDDQEGEGGGEGNRQSIWSNTSESQGGLSSQGMSRTSTTSSASHDSLLAGIPFLAPTSTSGGAGAGGSSVSLPINVSNTSPSTNTGDSSFPPPPVPQPTTVSDSRISLAVSTSSLLNDHDHDTEEDPLPAPFLPFAGQRPTSTSSTTSKSTTSPTKDPSSSSSTNRVQSEHFSVRSGFGSGLSQIPFQLGFPSGFGDGEGEGEGEGEEGNDRDNSSSILPTPPTSPPQKDPDEEEEEEDSSNPFGDEQEIDGADPRASMDTLALNQALSANLDAQG
ncbi:uncharacterized protein JCM6883_000537 [Sporobolomyces salmoneus]|uniref:uncharacterized protein n=1 Tax=Sporobolomyces salmoneus TaxID=183962 RepID=UPI0031768A46